MTTGELHQNGDGGLHVVSIRQPEHGARRVMRTIFGTLVGICVFVVVQGWENKRRCRPNPNDSSACSFLVPALDLAASVH
jgi:hypothetical protein